jgi:hypothetical protein
MFDRYVAEASYRRLAQLLDQSDRATWPSCLVLVGDQVYVDATAGLFDPTSRYDLFERPYERLFRDQGPVGEVTRRVPMYAMLDDHEIEDNWEPIAEPCDPEETKKSLHRLDCGRSAYLKFQRDGVPLGAGVPPSQLWYPTSVSGFPFFMADTRTDRMARTAQTVERALIISKPQWDDLVAFLAVPATLDLPKFIASPSILLPRRQRAIQDLPASALRSDAWDGYPASLYALLAHLADKELRNVVFLSGDEHISCVTRAEIVSPEGRTAVIHSVHSSPLYGPFPFANSVRDDLAHDEPSFQFDVAGRRYECKLGTRFPPAGDGFAVLKVSNDGSGWHMSCDFHRVDDPLDKTHPIACAL